ncbi:MAG: MptD family putative ECF transporter S component [Lachnospiraceae bacterium]|nr:MptD family putative ECF transporter S component [Lachnospiraceae bacterium]
MKKLKIKDCVTVALLSALYIIFYMIAGSVVMVFGAFGHAISPGACGLIVGPIIYFLTRKVGKMGQFTLMQAIVMIIYSVMGAGYLPWLITSMVGALIADLIASRESRPATWKVGIASGVFHVGQAFGSIIPSWFFVDSYREEWIGRGQTPEAMDAMIYYTQGFMGVIATVVVFALSFVGAYFGQLLLKKHLDKNVEKKAAA